MVCLPLASKSILKVLGLRVYGQGSRVYSGELDMNTLNKNSMEPAK